MEKLIEKWAAFDVLGKKFFFCPATASSYELDGKSWKFIHLCKKYYGNSPTCPDRNGLLKYLCRNFDQVEAIGLLDEFQSISDANKSERPAEHAIEHTPASLTYVVFNISHSCNMKCSYCCVEKGSFGGPEMLMSKGTARQAVDFIAQYFRGNEIEIGFFGGEPLLNFETLELIVEYFKAMAAEKGKATKFRLTTNGTLLTKDIVDFLSKNDFSLIVSVDGPRHIHDEMRKFKGGGGTHDVILRNLSTFCGTPLSRRTALRATYARGLTRFIERAIHLEELVDAGYGSVFSVEPVMSLPASPEYVFLPEQFQELKSEYDCYAKIFLNRLKEGRPAKFFHFCQYIERLMRRCRVERDCEGGISYVVINPAGELFGCHQEGQTIGDIVSGFDDSERSRWLGRCVDKKDGCITCWARYICGGGCELEYWYANKAGPSARKFQCELRKHLIKLAIWMLSELKKNE